MDQLKQSMAAAGKYGFWISTVVITLGSVGVWFMTTSKLSEENQQRASTLKSDIQSVTQVRSALPTHPNQHSHSKMEELIDGRQAEVLEAWTSVFERQQSILKWPRELQEDFVQEFEGLIPIERFIDFPPTPEQQKNTDLLFRYATYIGTTLPRIAEIAKTEWTAEFQKAAAPAGGMGGYGEDMGGYGGDMGGDMGGYGGDMGGYGMGGGPGGPGGPAGARRRQRGEKEPLVRWSRASQQQVMSDLFPWLGRRPSTLQVYYSQENIWILKQLLQIIANVNGDANQPFQAKIREISRIGIGASVDFEMGNLAQPGEGRRAGGMGGYGIEGGMGGMYDSGPMEEGYEDYEGGGEMMEGGPGGGAAPAAMDPAENRYVDMQNQPIPASTLRTALTSNRPEDAPIAVAKRVPVMMRVKMDQRFVPQLIAECGSAPLMVEVRRVRILPPSSRPGGGGDMGGYGMGGEDMGGYGGDMGGYGEDYGMGGEGGYGDPGGGFGSQAGGRQGKSEEFPLDVDVEVYGLIYIYNPPDPEKLGLEQVTEDTVIDGSTATGDQAPAVPEEPTEPAEPTEPVLPDEPIADPPVETPGPPAAGETQPDDADPQDTDEALEPEAELPPPPDEPGDAEAAEPVETADPPQPDSPVAAAAP